MDNHKKIETIYKLNEELQALLNEESDLYKKAVENRDNKIMLKRGDKEIEATEGELFEEIRVVGLKGEAGRKMSEKYPKLFEIAEKREKMNEELHGFILKELGFSFKQMSIVDYMKLTSMLIENELEKRVNK